MDCGLTNQEVETVEGEAIFFWERENYGGNRRRDGWMRKKEVEVLFVARVRELNGCQRMEPSIQ